MQEDDLMSDFPFAFDPSPASSKLKRQCEHAANSDSSEDEFDLVNIPRTRPKGDVLGSTAGKRVESFCDASIGMTAEKCELGIQISLISQHIHLRYCK